MIKFYPKTSVDIPTTSTINFTQIDVLNLGFNNSLNDSKNDDFLSEQ